MAEYIVSTVIQNIASQLIASQLVDEAASLSGVRDEVEWIEGELRRMRCFLKDADAKQDGDERVRNWVADIRDVAYDTEDVIDTYILKMAWRREKGLSKLFKRYPFVLNELAARRKIYKEISRIKNKIQGITNSRSCYGIENIGSVKEGARFAVEFLREKRRSYPHACEEDIVGLAEDIRILEDRVIHGELRRSVISIIGMAGLGKTTLAKRVYHSSDVKKCFDCCAWVYVSQEYRAGEILRDLCKKVLGLGKVELEKMHREDLEEELSKFLKQKRYLIVLDDLWKKEVWDDLKAAFPDSKNGSRIMFTTRFKDVALHADPISTPHELSLLNDEDSWNLLSKKVCLEWNAPRTLPPWCGELGKQMVKKCGGLPLAIVVLGGLLSRKEATYSEWLKVLQSVHWQLTQDSTQYADILALSFRDLPNYLKSCFLYLGLFPEDFEISARRLILLWVAEGFVQPRGQEPLEDVAEDYLEELIGRSMIQAAIRKSNGRIKTVRVHDLLRELSISKAKEDWFLDVINGDVKANFYTRARRLAIHFGIHPTTRNTSGIRSLLFFDPSEPVCRELKKYKLLRVFDLEGVYIAQLGSAIGNLIHLRYLGLKGTWLKQLPSSICHLMNLQTLDLRSTLIDPIPLVIWKLQQLRHLYFNELLEMVVNPPMDVSLQNLQTLQGICIGKTSCIEKGLDTLTNLGELGLYGHLVFQEEALGKWLFNLIGLQRLKLDAITRREDTATAGIPKLMTFSRHIHLYKLHLGGFIKLFDIQDFPPNLTELSLQGSFLMEDPMEKLEKLPSLRVLKLKHLSYVGKQMVCTSGGFAQLQLLKLSFLYSVETWRIEEGAMSNLRQLEIVECKRLKIVTGELWPLTTPCNLKLGFMPLDFEKKVRDLKGENWHRIEHVLPV